MMDEFHPWLMFGVILMIIFTNFHMNYLNWIILNVLLQMFNELLWNDFSSLYSRFYEVTYLKA
jgi:hypothetical protein